MTKTADAARVTDEFALIDYDDIYPAAVDHDDEDDPVVKDLGAFIARQNIPAPDLRELPAEPKETVDADDPVE